MSQYRLKMYPDGRIDTDVDGMRQKSRSRRIKWLYGLAFLGVFGTSIALADYYLSDGTKVQWAGPNNPNKVLVNGQLRDAVRNADGRLVPTSINGTQRQETSLLGRQSAGSGDARFNVQSRLTVPVFTNGTLTGFANVWHDANGLGRTYYTNSNQAGQQNQSVVSGSNGGTADFNWSRVDLTARTSTRTQPSAVAQSPYQAPRPASYAPTYAPSSQVVPQPVASLIGFQLLHNSAWEQVRVKEHRSVQQFYAGEPIVVRVQGQGIRTARVQFLFGNPQQDLPKFVLAAADRRPSFEQIITFSGQQTEGWLKQWSMIPDGTYQVKLDVTFTNGQTATRSTVVQITGSVVDMMQPGGTDL